MKIMLPEKPETKSQWHHWFAWHPVRIGDYLVWLEVVRRKGKYFEDSMGGGWSWSYDLRPAPLAEQGR